MPPSPKPRKVFVDHLALVFYWFAMNEPEVLALLRLKIEEAGGRANWARTHKFSREFLYFVLTGRKQITSRMLTAIGMREIVTYEPMEGATDD